MVDGDTFWHLQMFLQCIKYVIVEFTPSIILLYPPPPFLEWLQQVSFHRAALKLGECYANEPSFSYNHPIPP
jgi:hypothetical protein